MGSAASTQLRRPLVSSLEKAACRGSSGASRCSRDSTSEFSRTFDAVFAKVDDRTHCPSGWLDSGGVFAGVDRQLVMRPDPATQYPGTANVLWRVFHFLGLSAAELSSTGSGRTTDPALEDIAAVAERAELTVTALDEKANVWVAFKQGGQPVAVIVVEVKGNVGRVKPKVGVSIYAVTAAAAPGSATTIEEALDLTSSESKKDRRLLTDELKALLGEAPNLRRWAHMRVLSHASVNDDDIEWRIQIAPRWQTIEPGVHEAKQYNGSDGMRYGGRNASKRALQALSAALAQSDVVQAARSRQCGQTRSSPLRGSSRTVVSDQTRQLLGACHPVQIQILLQVQIQVSWPCQCLAQPHPGAFLFCDTQGEHEDRRSGNQSDKLLLFASKLGNVAVLESSGMHFGQKALRTTAGVEPLLFACVAAVQGRCTDAANKHKAGGVGMDMLWIA